VLLKLVIVGARDHARLVHDAVLAMNAVRPTFQFDGFVSHGPSRPDVIEKRSASILGGLDYFETCNPETLYIVGLGSPEDRKAIDQQLAAKGFGSATVIHPSAIISPYAGTIEAGCYVGPLVTIQTEAKLGRHVHIGAHANVGHDNALGDYTILSPGVMSSGHVSYGKGVMVGAGAAVLPEIEVGDWSTIGAGAVVRENVDRGLTVVGVPATPLPGRVSSALER
jgi:sugar O-acyltransferase (sialic acid O-acetyltransferase NeuD family)